MPRVVIGSEHSCALLADGAVKCWGLGEFGQLGQASQQNVGDGANEMGSDLVAVDLGSSGTAISIAAGCHHTCVILQDHSVKCWGRATSGRLGSGTGGADDNVGDGPNEMGDNLAAVPLGTGKSAIALAAGCALTCAILNDHTLKCWGGGSFGKTGQGNTENLGNGPNELGDNLEAVQLGTGKTALAVTAGGHFTCVLLNDGSVKCFGRNHNGQLGIGHQNDIGDSSGEMGDSLVSVNLGTGKTALSIAAGTAHVCAVLNDGSAKCWGQGTHGRLGLGSSSFYGRSVSDMGDNLPTISLGTSKRALSMSAGRYHTCAVLSDHSLKCWGRSNVGQIGQGNTLDVGDSSGEMGEALPIVNLGSSKTALFSFAGGVDAQHSCALLNDGTVKCWGSGDNGMLGQGGTDNVGDAANQMGDSLSAISLDASTRAVQIAAGAEHSTLLAPASLRRVASMIMAAAHVGRLTIACRTCFCAPVIAHATALSAHRVKV